MSKYAKSHDLLALETAVVPEKDDSCGPADSVSQEKTIDASRFRGNRLVRKGLGFAAAFACSLPFLSGNAIAAETPSVSMGEQPQQVATLTPVRTQKCSPSHKVQFSLSGPETVTSDVTHKYHLTIKRCAGTSIRAFKKIKVSETSTMGQKKAWKAEEYKPGQQKKKSFSIKFDDALVIKKKMTNHRTRKIDVRATTATGKKIGSGGWRVKYDLAHKGRAAKAETCTPRPDFAVGIQDDEAFVWERYGPRDGAFRLAAETYGANVLRFNVLYDDWKQYGPQSYIDTVAAAQKHGFKVFVTLVPTPLYRAGGDQTLSHANESREEMRKFAQNVVTVLGPGVDMVEIGNEPQIRFFSASQNYSVYDNMALGGKEGVNSANPHAQVVLGGLAPGSADGLVQWIQSLQGKADAVSMHPYGDLINAVYLKRFIAAAGSAVGRPLILSEYANFGDNPNQMADNLSDIELARCLGARMIIMYLIYDIKNNEMGWHTGFITVPEPSTPPRPVAESALVPAGS